MGPCISEIIDCLLEHERTATFFVVGELAERYPELVRRMATEGFEIATHSHTHPRFDRNAPDENIRELRQSKETLEDITGQAVVGFRAPSWSVRLHDDWLWDYLSGNGFEYDSSLFPFKTHMYGSFDNPTRPFRVRPKLWEIPPSVAEIAGARIPYGGGFYFRLLPWWMTSALGARAERRGQVPVTYLHPWEFERDDRPPKTGVVNSFIGNFGISRTWRRLNALLRSNETTTMAEMVRGLPAS
jgi:peptidoglycan-N-acetylglucosamine deacetylase